MSHLLDHGLSPAEIARTTAIQGCFGVSSLAGAKSHRDLLVMVGDTTVSAQRRAGFLFFILGGAYPTIEQLTAIGSFIEQGSYGLAFRECTRQRRWFNRSVLPLVLDTDIVDVTRYSAQPRPSGIPRVVRNLAFSPSFADTTVGVWEDGVLGVGQRVPGGGRIALSRRHWRRPHRNKGILFRLYWALWTLAGFRTGGLRLLQLFGNTLMPLATRLIRHRQRPRYTILLVGGKYFLPEVPDAEVSRRLEAWKQVVPELKLNIIVHDLLPLTHPEYFSKTANREHLFLTRLLAKSERLFVGTPVLAKQLRIALKLFDQEARPEIVGAPLPISSPNAPELIGDETNDKPYFLFFGGFEPRKGLDSLVGMIESTAPNSVGFRIIVLGPPMPNQPRESWETARRALNRQDVFTLAGSVGDEQLGRLIAGAVATLYLSHAEGYGLPVLESIAHGTPVICRPGETNEYFATRYGGIWPQFINIPADMLPVFQSVADSPSAYAALGVTAPEVSKVPISIERWARMLRGNATVGVRDHREKAGTAGNSTGALAESVLG